MSKSIKIELTALKEVSIDTRSNDDGTLSFCLVAETDAEDYVRRIEVENREVSGQASDKFVIKIPITLGDQEFVRQIEIENVATVAPECTMEVGVAEPHIAAMTRRDDVGSNRHVGYSGFDCRETLETTEDRPPPSWLTELLLSERYSLLPSEVDALAKDLWRKMRIFWEELREDGK